MSKSTHFKLGALILLLLLIGLIPGQKIWVGLIFGGSAFRILAGLALVIALIPASSRPFPDGWVIRNAFPTLALLLLVSFPTQRLEDPPTGPGDSLHLAEFIPVFSELFGFLATPDELLELFIRSKSYLLLEDWLSAPTAIGIYSYLAGLIHIAAVHFFLKRRPQSLIPGWLILFFIPASAVYAGYIENYAMSRALILTLLLMGWEALESSETVRRLQIVRIMAVIAGLTVLHHLIAGLILPALVWLLYRSARGMQDSMWVFVREGLLCTAAAVAIIAPVYLTFYLSSTGPLIFSDSHVGFQSMTALSGLFSGKNLSKILQLLLIVPVSLAFLPGIFKKNDSISVFLVAAAIPFFLFAFIWNAAIGFPADWDLFSYFLIPLSVLTLHALPSETKISIRSAALLAALTLAPMVSWMTWLNNKTELTEKNLVFIQHIRANTVPELHQDKSLKNISTERQKMYLRILLFRERLIFRLQRLKDDRRIDEAQQRDIRGSVDRGMQIYSTALNAPKEEYDSSLSAAQKLFYPAFVTVDHLWNEQ